MVSNTRDRSIDSSEREDSRIGKVDRCEVINIRPHVKPYPDDKDFNTVDVKIIDRPRPDLKIDYIKLNPILPLSHGRFQGHPYNPRIGDMIYIYWLAKHEAIVLGACTSIEQEPVCRSCANDKHHEFVWKLCPWEEPTLDNNKNYVEFPKPKHPICTKWWPVQMDGETIRRDWIQVWDCKNGHDRPECDEKAPCNKPDDIKQRTWWKYLSDVSDTAIDEKWRVKFHHNSESVFLFDNDKTIHLSNKKACTTCGGSGCDGDCPECGGTKEVDGELCPTCGGTGGGVCPECNGDGCTEELGHSHTYPEGTWDIHAGGTQPNKDFIPLASENAGVRVSIVHPDDDSVDFSYEAIDFNIDSWIRILKTGDIKLHSLSDESYIDILGTESTVEVHGTDKVLISANEDITNLSPTIYENCSDHIITGFCTHGGCSCDSDKRLKTNIKGVESGLEDVLKLNPVSFNWKDQKTRPGTHLGFVAQEVLPLIPEVIQERPDGMLGIRYDELIPVLVNAIQELSAKVDSLEARLGEGQ